MNPLRRKRDHHLGAVVGPFIGFVVALTLGQVHAAGPFFAIWLKIPELYWPWPIFGAAIAGLGAYAVRLWKIPN